MDLKKSASELADLLDNRRRHLQSRAARRLWRIRRDAVFRSLDTRAQALQRLDRWTAPLEERALVGRVARWVDDGVSRAVDTGLPDYDELTAKQVASAVREIDDISRLHRIQRYEAANKERKTVARAVERRLAQLEPDVVAWKAWDLEVFGADDETTEAPAQA